MERQVVTIDYAPRKQQNKIHDALDNYRFVVTVAHRRMGKTVASIQELIKKAVKCTKAQKMQII